LEAAIEGAPQGASSEGSDQGLASEQTQGSPEGVSEQQGNQEPIFTLDDGTPVTAEEARLGYMRQRDYTHKTQTLAEQRKSAEADLELVSWLRESPLEALDWLNDQFADVRGQQAELDPVQQEVQELRGIVSDFQEQQRIAQIEGEIARLQKEHGAFNPDDLLAHAVDNKIPNLEVALIHMNAVKGKQQQQQQQNATEAAKRNLPPDVTGTATETDFKRKKNPTVAEALQETLREMGLKSMPPPPTNE
jgi:hypothetical protein